MSEVNRGSQNVTSDIAQIYSGLIWSTALRSALHRSKSRYNVQPGREDRVELNEGFVNNGANRFKKISSGSRCERLQKRRLVLRCDNEGA